MRPPRADADNLKATLTASAPAPGVVSLFFRNNLKDFDTYIYAIAEAMRDDTRPCSSCGSTADLRMGRHIQYAALDLANSASASAWHIAALNHATRNISARADAPRAPRRLRGPHDYDVPLNDIIDMVLGATILGSKLANPRHAHEYKVFKTIKLPAGKLLIPGVIENRSRISSKNIPN